MDKKQMMRIKIIAILSVIIFTIVVFQSVGNKAINIEEQVEVATSDIKIQEKRRVDLLFNLVDTVKEYDKHEYNTLRDIVEMRSNEISLGDISTMINATVEQYPELKSDTNYRQLMNELSITENLIAQHRSNYNKQIKDYNRHIKKFPNRHILNIIGFEAKEYQYLDYNVSVDAPQNLFEGR